MKRIILFSVLVLFFSLNVANSAANNTIAGEKILGKQCQGCHDLTGPAAQTVQELWMRKGPDLFYAGSKYKREWLVKWLEKPSRIRPAGYNYALHIVSGKKRDMVDVKSLSVHPSLSQFDAVSVTDKLMSLKAPESLVAVGEFKGGSISLSFGEMIFDKFNGCMACHEIEPNFGGLSGPEMYTAAKRLQADYMVSFIRSPKAWNPKTAMPNKHIKPRNIQKMVQYLQILSKENWDEK